ncbi:MAG: DUF4112 domain-containing protein [Gammaproteobacteria bacterium]|nr:DUF4112 domain-containing protein [Gammaproteobacteria bacterium]
MADRRDMTQPGPSAEKVRELVAFVDKTAWWLDDCLSIPGTRFRFGLDAIVGLIPFAGDALAFGVSALTITRAARAGVPRGVLLRMARNVAIDFAGGLVPGLGDVFDAVFKSHRRNFELLRKEYAPLLAPLTPRRQAPLWLRVAGALGVAAIGYGLWTWMRS